MGPPRSVVPIRVVAPIGDYELLVSERDDERARELLEIAGDPAPRPRRYRWLGWLLLLSFFVPILIQALASLFNAR